MSTPPFPPVPGVPRALVAALAAVLGAGVHAQALPAAGADAPLALKPARELAPAAATPPPARPGDRAGAPQRPRIGEDDSERGVVFLRADRLEGVADREVRAEGRVEFRTRRETVLADRITYDLVRQRGARERQRAAAPGRRLDQRTGARRFRREEQTGAFTEPRFSLGLSGARGDASKLIFAGPDRYEISDARYTSCVAPREDWFLTTRELEIDLQRNVGTARDATVRFFGAPIFYAPWLEFPLSNERKSGFLVPTAGSSNARGIEFAAPYYLNLAPNYDATITPRFMSKRGLQLGGEFRYLGGGDFGDGRRARRPVPVATARRTATATRSSGATSSASPHGFGGYVDLNKVSDDTYFADFGDRIAVTSQTTLPREAGLTWGNGPWSRARARADVPDAAGPERADHPALQPRAAARRQPRGNALGRAQLVAGSASSRASRATC